MKILVIDDTQVHLDAAIQQLSEGHDLTVCSSHEEADKLLQTRYAKKWRDCAANNERQGMSRDAAYKAASLEEKESEIPYWDAVLTDLLMPAGSMAQGKEGEEYVGQEMPVGWSLALRAAKMGAKYVAVVTDMDHHHHPASAMLDWINGHVFSIDSARMLLTNHVSYVGITGTEYSCSKCNGAGEKQRNDGSKYDCCYCGGTGTDYQSKGKDWLGILNQLLNPKKEAG